MSLQVLKSVLGLVGVLCCVALQAQNVVSAQDGAWDDASTWVGGVVPTGATTQSITINHAVFIPNGYTVTIDGATISAAGTLSVNSGGGLSVSNVADALNVDGTLIAVNGSSITGGTGANISFSSGSFYRHRFTTTEGVVPLATWDPNSTFVVEGYTTFTTTTVAGNWNQNFGNFLYNCTLQTNVSVDLFGRLTSVAGNFNVTGTGAGFLRLTDAETASITIGGAISLSGTSRLVLTRIGNATLNVAGDYNQSAGTFYAATGTDGKGLLSLQGDFTLTAGTFTETGDGTSEGTVQFTGSTSHNHVNTGTINNIINWIVPAGETVDMGVYAFKSAGLSKFTLGGTIIVGSTAAAGAIQNSITAGNIQTATSTGNRTYLAGSTVIYRSASPQFMGTATPTTTGVTTVIDNPQGVSLVGSINIGGDLDLEDGQLFIGGNTFTIRGVLTSNTGTFGGNTSSVLVVGGTTGGDFGTLVFGPTNNTLGTLTINRTGVGAAAALSSAVTIQNQLNLLSGDFSNISGLQLANGATLTRYSVSQLLVNRPLLNGTDSYNVIYRSPASGTVGTSMTTGFELPLASEIDRLANLNVLMGRIRDSVLLSQDIFVNGIVDFNRGFFYANSNTITMEGSDWLDDAGTFIPGTTGTVIFVGNTNVSGSTNPIFNSIQVNTGATINILRNLSIAGDIDFQSGSIVNCPGITFSINGAGLQTIAANGVSFHNIIVAKSGGNVQLANALNLIGLLRFNAPSANCNFMSNGFLTLLSTADTVGSAASPGTAQIYRLTGGNQVSGNLTVQRFMAGEGRIYRYISSPVSNATVASWKDDFAITGTFADPNTGKICNRVLDPADPSLFIYNETLVGDENVGYEGYPTAGLASANPLQVGRGYAAFIRRCDAPTVIDVTGPANQGTVILPVTYTNTGDPVADGYNLVGNPYPCTIDWDITGWTKLRISPVIAIKDNGAGGVMRYWDGDTQTGALSNGQIAPGQAFFVRATGGSPSLRVSENVKGLTPNQAGEFYRIPVSDVLKISLSNGLVTDDAFVKIREGAANTLDDWDAPKLRNELFDLYTLSEDQIRMAINAVSTVSCSSVTLGTENLTQGEYSLAIETMGLFKGFSYVLYDNFTGSNSPLTGAVRFTVTNNPLSSAADRFSLTMKPKTNATLSDINHTEFVCSAQPGKISIAETSGFIKYSVEANGVEISTAAGTGQQLDLVIPSEKLRDGINIFKLVSSSACGVLQERDISISVTTLPADYTVKNGSVCNSGSAKLGLENIPLGFNYKWYATPDSQVILGSESVFNTPVLSKSSTYYVSFERNGCLSERIPVKAEVIHLSEPVIQVSGNLLSVAGEHVEWLLDNEPVEGSFGNSFIAEKSGIYTARVTTGGCQLLSNNITIHSDSETISAISVYPNPWENKLNLESLTGSKNIHQVVLINGSGKRSVLYKGVPSQNLVLETNDILPGFYILEVAVEDLKYYYKVIRN
jgi:hypothetical protein